MAFSETGAAFPGQAAIDAYGNGGFRFAEMSHRGSIVCLASGIFAWDVIAADQLNLTRLTGLLGELAPASFLLLGTGDRQVFPSLDVRRAFMAANVGLEPMDTGAACRTYNVLLAEQRPVAAALIAVE